MADSELCSLQPQPIELRACCCPRYTQHKLSLWLRGPGCPPSFEVNYFEWSNLGRLKIMRNSHMYLYDIFPIQNVADGN